MLRKSFYKTIFAVLLVFVLSSAALALSPHDAISKRPSESLYVVLSMSDLGGLLQEIFSPANAALFKPFMEPEQAQGVDLVTGFASQIPANNVVIAAGITTDMMPFAQAAALMPASVRAKLDRVADGSATGADIVTLLMGDAALMFAGLIAPELKTGEKGPYYSLQDQVVFAAKDDLLLIASTPAELEASIGALEKKENRLGFKRRFDSSNYLLMHLDFLSFADIIKALGGEALDKAMIDPFKALKAPLELEYALTPKPGSYLVSSALNTMDALADTESLKNIKPKKGGGLLMVGGGKLLFAISSPLLFKADDYKEYPEFVKVWEQIIKGLEAFGISESDVIAMLNGFISLSLGSDATVMGKNVPGGFVTLTGQEGMAAKILENLVSNPLFSASVPISQLKVNGWDTLYTLNQEIVPIPVLFGVMKDTLFLGFVDSDALGKKPQTSPEVTKMLDNSLIGAGVIDTGAIWNRLRQETSDPASLLSLVPGIEEAKGILDELLKADLSIPLIKIWAPDMETSYTELSLANVPEEKQLLPRLINLAQMFK